MNKQKHTLAVVSSSCLILGLLALVQDWMGVDAWTAFERSSWTATPWYFWIIVLVLSAVGIYRSRQA